MRAPLTATCLTTLTLLLAVQARADTTISTATTAPLNTAAAGNITVTADGTITPTAGTAVTINTNSNVSNAGKITFLGVDNAAGIVGTGGLTSSITNTGTISLDENYTRTDTNADTVLDGPYAQGTNRTAIRIDGTAPFVSTISNTGTITVRGNNSAGIYVAAPLTGAFSTNGGAISVTGDNTYGVRLGSVSGNVLLGTATSLLGGNSVGAALTGDVGGQVVVHNTITSTGYSSTTLPTDVTKLTAQNVEQSGSALVISGNVAKGILIAGAPADTTNTTADTDADGAVDSTEAAAALTTYGSAPSMLIGSSSNAITIGTFTSGATSTTSPAGLTVNGSVTGVGVYSGVNATGLQLGGLGQNVTISGGMAVGGTIAAASNGGAASALHVSSGVTIPTLTVSGKITGAASATAGGSAIGVQIDSSASLPSITNSGIISATVTATSGASAAILDNSNTLRSVTNNGSISGSSTGGGARAVDVSGSTAGFTYTQALASSTQTTTPSTTGAILTGSGADTIAISAGVIQSDFNTGAGNDTVALSGNTIASATAELGDGDDVVTLADKASWIGTIDFGGGSNTLTIGSGAGFLGSFVNSGANNAVTLNGGTLAFNTTATQTIGSLTANGGTIGVSVDPATGTHGLLVVTGATKITAPTTIDVALSSFSTTPASYPVLQSGTLTGSSNLSLSIQQLPYLLTGTLQASDTSGAVAVSIAPKTASQLSLRQSEATAYPAVLSAIQTTPVLSAEFLGLTDRDATLLRYREMLPDHAGGVFDVMSEGNRALAPTAGASPWAQLGGLSLWAQQAVWNARQDAETTPGDRGSGWGLTAGGDVALGTGTRVGLSVGYVHGDIRDSGDNEVTANQFGGGAHWLGDWGGFHIAAYGNAGYVLLHERRAITGSSETAAAILTSKDSWNGFNVGAGAKASYDLNVGHFYLRPSAQVTYDRLSEGSHSGSGGGTGFDLIVDKRTTSELAAYGMLGAGVQFGNTTDPNTTLIRFGLEGGRRQVLDSSADGTTAHFAGGQDFTLLPEERKSGYVGGLNASIGSSSFRFVASAVYETRGNGHTMSGRFGIRGSF